MGFSETTLRTPLSDSAISHPDFAKLTHPKYGIYDAETNTLFLEVSTNPHDLLHNPAYMEKLAHFRRACEVLPQKSFEGIQHVNPISAAAKHGTHVTKETGWATVCFVYNHAAVSLNYCSSALTRLGYDVLFDQHMPKDFPIPRAKRVYPSSTIGLGVYDGLVTGTEYVITVACNRATGSPAAGAAAAAAYHLAFTEQHISPKTVRDTLITAATGAAVARATLVPKAYKPITGTPSLARAMIAEINQEAMAQGLSSLLIVGADEITAQQGEQEMRPHAKAATQDKSPMEVATPMRSRLPSAKFTPPWMANRIDNRNIRLGLLPIAAKGSIAAGMGIAGLELGITATVVTWTFGSALVFSPAAPLVIGIGIYLNHLAKKKRKAAKHAINKTQEALNTAKDAIQFQNNQLVLAQSASSIEQFNNHIRASLANANGFGAFYRDQKETFRNREKALKGGLKNKDYEQLKNDVNRSLDNAQSAAEQIKALCHFALKSIRKMHDLFSSGSVPNHLKEQYRALLIKKLFLQLQKELNKETPASEESLWLVETALHYERNVSLRHLHGVLLLNIATRAKEGIAELEYCIQVAPNNAVYAKSLLIAYCHQTELSEGKLVSAVRMATQFLAVEENAKDRNLLEMTQQYLQQQLARGLDKRLGRVFLQMQQHTAEPAPDITLATMLEKAKQDISQIQTDLTAYTMECLLADEDLIVLEKNIGHASELIDQAISRSKTEFAEAKPHEIPNALLLKQICEKHYEHVRANRPAAARAIQEGLAKLGIKMSVVRQMKLNQGSNMQHR